MGGADRRREAGFGAQRIAAGDKGEIVRAAAQLVDEIGDQIVEPAGFANQADERLARHGLWRGGFKSADAIAMKLGIEKTAMIRLRAGISYALTEAMDEGHCGCRWIN